MLLSLLFLTSRAQSQTSGIVKWTYTIKKIKPTEAILFLQANIEQDWHLFSTNQKPMGPLKTTFTFSKSSTYAVIGKVEEPAPITKFDETFKVYIMYFEKEVIFEQKLVLKSADVLVKGKIEFMACNESQCLTPEQVEFSIPIK